MFKPTLENIEKKMGLSHVNEESNKLQKVKVTIPSFTFECTIRVDDYSAEIDAFENTIEKELTPIVAKALEAAVKKEKPDLKVILMAKEYPFKLDDQRPLAILSVFPSRYKLR